MMKKKNVLQNLALIAVLVISFGSCENDFAELGTDLVGVTNFNTDLASFPVISYNKPIGPFQSNTFPDNLFGIYTDPVFGPFSANIVSQMVPTDSNAQETEAVYDPVFGVLNDTINVVLDSVVLTIPYFSTIIETDSDGNVTYELDSLYGNDPINLSIYENNYFLRNFDPNSEFDENQKYYSDRSLQEGNVISESELEFLLIYEDDEFLPNEDQIVLTEYELDEDGDFVLDEDGEPITFESGRLAPSYRKRLDQENNNYWYDLIFAKEGEPELSNENNFLNYFRGLYFKADALNGEGNMSQFNIDGGNITLYYTREIYNGGNTELLSKERDTYTLSFTSNVVSFYENNFTVVPETGDPVNGNERLYLKGAQGHMAILNLFNDDETIIEELKQQNWLINEARLVFYVDQDIVNGKEPDRIYLYDLNNNIPLIDYFFDQSGGSIPEAAKIDHLQPLTREGDDPDGQGIKYEIEITEHIKNIIDNDSTNVKLGLLVTANAISVTDIDLQNEDGCPSIISSGAAVSPRGTVLHGNASNDETKRLKLDIFYTEPNDL